MGRADIGGFLPLAPARRVSVSRRRQPLCALRMRELAQDRDAFEALAELG